ncbi:uncharacterized protein LOC126193291 [Schistocerca nitens]|uniref:uncharacterized protein LOC126193291 n=1 Tax=Schistocerca nitens TaxID=7011 RepID=UPI0021182D35|nr:uncharacterized protein LOC126193291 [Schistocerca nitens]
MICELRGNMLAILYTGQHKERHSKVRSRLCTCLNAAAIAASDSCGPRTVSTGLGANGSRHSFTFVSVSTTTVISGILTNAGTKIKTTRAEKAARQRQPIAH